LVATPFCEGVMQSQSSQATNRSAGRQRADKSSKGTMTPGGMRLILRSDQRPETSRDHPHRHFAPPLPAERGFMSDFQYCSVKREGAVTLITIERPEVMNALHPPATLELARAFDDFAADASQWIAIVTGAGDRAFCAGNDLKYQAGGGEMRRSAAGFGGLTARFDLDKPVIAAVNGVAMGGGFEIALACDLIVASANAVFALPEPRVGLAALAGGIQRLGRQIGAKQAMGMVLTGRHVGAEEGRGLGFVNEVVAPGAALAGARQWAAQILACSPMSIRAAKQVMLRGFDEPTLAAAIGNERGYPAAQAMFASADYVEGPKAFAEKRAPRWQGI
jgi:enoyl-CoA hydratase/carnithine racemase